MSLAGGFTPGEEGFDPLEVPEVPNWWVLYAVRHKGVIFPGRIRVQGINPDEAVSHVWKRLQREIVAADNEVRIVRIFLDKAPPRGYATP